MNRNIDWFTPGTGETAIGQRCRKEAAEQCPECGGSGKVSDPAQIGARMREHRERHGLSGREVARRMGYSAAYVSDLELDRRGWSARLVEEYRDAIASFGLYPHLEAKP